MSKQNRIQSNLQRSYGWERAGEWKKWMKGPTVWQLLLTRLVVVITLLYTQMLNYNAVQLKYLKKKPHREIPFHIEWNGHNK